jgi:hypothetical protein
LSDFPYLAKMQRWWFSDKQKEAEERDHKAEHRPKKVNGQQRDDSNFREWKFSVFVSRELSSYGKVLHKS